MGIRVFGRKRSVKSNPLVAAGDAKLTIRASPGRLDLLTRELRAYTFEQLYARQLWVHVCVNKIARGIARLPIKTYRFVGDPDAGNRERIRDDPLPRLLARPWPGASAWQLKEFVVGSCAVHGNALLAKGRRTPSSPPEELWPVPWRNVEVRQGAHGQPERFIFHGARGKIELAPRDVVHFPWGTAGATVGVSPLEPLKPTLRLELAAQDWASQHFLNAATPSGVFTSEDKLDQRTIPRLRAELEQLYGGVENAGRFGVFDQGLKWQPMAHTAVDTALIEQRKLDREEVAAAFDIPPPMIGILDRATFSNVSEQHRMLYQDTLGPTLSMIEETLAVQLIADEPTFAGLFVEFDTSEVLRGDLEKRADAIAKLIASGVLTPNEARQLENRPRIEDPAADAIYVPLNLVPVGATPEDIGARAAAIALLGPAAREPVPRDAAPMLGE